MSAKRRLENVTKPEAELLAMGSLLGTVVVGLGSLGIVLQLLGWKKKTSYLDWFCHIDIPKSPGKIAISFKSCILVCAVSLLINVAMENPR